MGEVTHISWADHTFNPWIGCTEVSVGDKGACVACYARELAKRYSFAEWGNHPRHRTSEANWKKPLAWNRKAKKDGTRPFVFCASLADVFDNQVSPDWRRDLFKLIDATPHLTWLLLTKRPQNIVSMWGGVAWPKGPKEGVPEHAIGGGFVSWPSNAAILCTIVTQAEADRDLNHLLRAKAALRPAFAGVSMEPLMEGVDIRWALSRNRIEIAAGILKRGDFSPGLEMLSGLDWVITGGETDQGKFKARPSHPAWFRSLRDQCAAAGVPFHFKQWGEFEPWTAHPGIPWGEQEPIEPYHQWVDDGDDGSTCSVRVGKKRSGRALDGVIHDARPVVA